MNLDVYPVRLAESAGSRTYRGMNIDDWWWDAQDQIPTGAMIVPVICASDKTHWTNSLGNQHAWPLNFTVGNIQKDIRHTRKGMCIFFELIP